MYWLIYYEYSSSEETEIMKRSYVRVNRIIFCFCYISEMCEEDFVVEGLICPGGISYREYSPLGFC